VIELAPILSEMARRGQTGRLLRAVAFEGIGGRRYGEALVITDDGGRHGSLLGGLAERELAAGLSQSGLFELEVGDKEAVSAGLACGGRISVLVSALEEIPAGTWEALEEGGFLAIVTRPGEKGPLVVVDDPSNRSRRQLGSLGDPQADAEGVELAREALRRGHQGAEVLGQGDRGFVVEVLAPVPRLVVLGAGELGEALCAQARLLGWEASSHEGPDEALTAVLGGLRASDALVVLTHDHDEATPVLLRALPSRCFVGALGSRHTQAERRRRLEDAGLEPAAIERLRGPVGLDLGSRTPEETALSITAEILAWKNGREPRPLSSTSGPING
jgi:xanthine dehydrogenase accessory factor